MVCEKRPDSFRVCVPAFAAAAKESAEKGAAYFGSYVTELGGNFHLAVLNVGDVLLNRVLGHEALITAEERRLHPNVVESIAAARSKQPVSVLEPTF